MPDWHTVGGVRAGAGPSACAAPVAMGRAGCPRTRGGAEGGVRRGPEPGAGPGGAAYRKVWPSPR